ncbi:MAG TPA: cytochrome c oxidase subunit I [Gemmatimonadaceae bacterium]|nr:cytochrome c oxidase subunit I [Gemmatimonadaceae bacterium]
MNRRALWAGAAEGLSRERREAFARAWASPGGAFGLVRTINNIPIARRYMVAGFLFFLAGGVLALLMRLQLGTPENTFLDAETYDQIFTMHGTTMMFLFVIPFIEAVANYLLPLLLGTRDMPFPRLTALSFWTYVFGGLFLYASFLWGLAPDGGWFSYVPLNNRQYAPSLNMDFWDIGLSVAEVAAMGAAAELIVAILRMRAPGMRLDRIPLFAWAMLVTAVMIIFGFTPLIVGTAMLELDRKGLTAFFVPEAGGEPLLWQHLFWVFGHPEVYIMFVPAVGIVSQVVQVFSRRPIVSYTLMVLAIVATGFLSFGLWAHHMFTTGLSMVAMSFFTAASLVITIPNGIQMFGWIATLWTGRPVLRTPLLFVLGFIVIFLLGGVSGVMVGAVPFDSQAHDSYFVVAHFHYVLIGGVVFPLFAGLYYWLPKVTGRMLSERLGRWNFWTMFVFFHVAFFPMHVTGLLGMPRRVYTYPAGLGWDALNLVSTIGAFGFATGVALFVANVLWSLKRGAEAGDDPWGGDTLEWAETSPPADAQFEFIPVVRGRHPLWEQASLTARGSDWEALLAPLQAGPTTWRGALVVDVVEARPRAVVHVPGPTAAPFVMAVGFLLVFAAALLEHALLLAAGAVVTLVALGRWFWPQPSESRALREVEQATDGRSLPLATAGPMANGFWGTVVFLLVLTTALACVVSSYFYLSDGPAGWPPPGSGRTGVALPALAAALLVAAAAITWWLRRALHRAAAGAVRLAVVALLAAALGQVAVSVTTWRRWSLEPAHDAYGSAVLGLVGFQWLVEAVLATMLVIALLWAWRRPRDPRGHAVAHNAALVSYFAATSGLVVLGVLHLSPYVW